VNGDPSPEQQKIIQQAVDQLREHFDSVTILVTKDEVDRTTNAVGGGGDFFARYGMIKHWLMREEEKTKREVWP